jgi:putative membrane protein
VNFINKVIISTLAVLLVGSILPGVHVENVLVALLVALVLAFLNSIVKPLLILLTLPITLFTLGFFLLVINALIILIADKLIDQFSVDSFWTALFFSIILSLVTSVFESLAGNKNRENK